MVTRTAREIWEATLGELQIQISKPNYRTWFEKTIGLDFQGNQFIVGVPNTFVAEYLDQNQRSLIEKSLIGLTSPDIQLVFQVNGKRHTSSSGAQVGNPTTLCAQGTYPHGFNPNYVFDSYVEGSCNRLAYAAARAVAQNPGRTYNPLFIYGGVGLGKTHLLHAIGHAAQSSQVTTLCTSGEQFTNEFINSIRERKTEEFRTKYRSVGMLLIDDIHFIGGKEQTAESFFHTFNELHNANRQIVITSDRPPKSMPYLADRLRSRFEWGLMVEIQPPDFETRLAILRAKSEYRGMTLDPNVLELIGHKIQRNIRELEGSLNRVIAYARLLCTVPTIDLATKALEDLTDTQHCNISITPDLIIEAVADSFQLSPDDIKDRKRDKETVLARRVAMYIIRQETSLPVVKIGQVLGRRDAAAVTNACQKIAGDIDESSYLRRKILDIQQRIHSQIHSN